MLVRRMFAFTKIPLYNTIYHGDFQFYFTNSKSFDCTHYIYETKVVMKNRKTNARTESSELNFKFRV